MLLGGVKLVVWVPSPIGLAGNSEADIAAEAALYSYQSATRLYTDYLSLIRIYVLSQWQES
jgi:hypothetical protein